MILMHSRATIQHLIRSILQILLPQTIFVTLSNVAGCRTYINFQLLALLNPAAKLLPPLMQCGSYDTTLFNLKSYEDLLIGDQENFTKW